MAGSQIPSGIRRNRRKWLKTEKEITDNRNRHINGPKMELSDSDLNKCDYHVETWKIKNFSRESERIKTH